MRPKKVRAQCAPPAPLGLIDPKNFEHLANVQIKNLKYVCYERICSVDKNIIKAFPKLIDFRYPFMMLKFS